MKAVLQDIARERYESGMQVDDVETDSDEEEEEVGGGNLDCGRARLRCCGPQQEEEFYTPGSEELLYCRRKIALYSLKR